MTDKVQDVSDFSFRTFDIYRRFVEVLQCKPAYLKEFKNGSPKEETCLSIINRAFQSQQEEEEIKKYIEYFAIHAKMLAGHAEKLPDNWNQAIDYTDRYIKVIRNYLAEKGISVRSVLNSVEKIAEDIAKHLHDSPSVKQIEAIKYYLKYDLRNPKKNVSLNTSRKLKNKSKKSSKSLKKSKTTSDKVVEDEKNILVLKENDQSTACESIEEDKHLVLMHNEDDFNDEQIEPLQFEHIETEIVVDDLLETIKQEYEIITMDTDNFNDEKNVVPESSLSNNFIAEEIENIYEVKIDEETRGIEQSCETDPANSLSTIFDNGNDDKYPNHNFNLKRKSSSSLENDHYCSLKKQLQLCRRIPNNVPQEQTVIQSQAVRIRSVSDNSSDSDVDVEYDNYKSEMQDNAFMEMNRFVLDSNSEEKTSLDSEINESLQNSMLRLEALAHKMSYTTAMKYMDLLITFCTLKNVISQDELLTMQQIRDKIYLKILNEPSAM